MQYSRAVLLCSTRVSTCSPHTPLSVSSSSHVAWIVFSARAITPAATAAHVALAAASHGLHLQHVGPVRLAGWSHATAIPVKPWVCTCGQPSQTPIHAPVPQPPRIAVKTPPRSHEEPTPHASQNPSPRGLPLTTPAVTRGGASTIHASHDRYRSHVRHVDAHNAGARRAATTPRGSTETTAPS